MDKNFNGILLYETDRYLTLITVRSFFNFFFLCHLKKL
ncbi:Uncharacterized protein dnm_009060 [Desulfonema magnum]|uniref:Uncharacterized protein n=1 Tax=Desulfonema magnum TaxID=45655 RepID=A0A975BGJ9_9BACT|nr:Uncharacterized protein dnm_009060 [Desulfonema magnum]